ncbi:MAG: DNA primase small subunit domain-containing protein [Nanobdellota archaeon]
MEKSFSEERIRKITKLYYSRPEIQKVIFEFSKNREISPRYFEGFGKRPDVIGYPGDVFELANRGATSFHCSEELWDDPLKIETGMNEKQLNELRIGWDLLIDIDCKYFDFSKKAARAIINVFKQHGIKNFGLKFSGSKGLHLIVPWKAFPKEIAGEKTKNLFPELPRKLLAYIRFKAEEEMKNLVSDEELDKFKETKIKKGIKCNTCKELAQEYELAEYACPKCYRRESKKIFNSQKKDFKCPDCGSMFKIKQSRIIYECKKCNISSKDRPENFSRHIEIDLFELMGLDLIMVSPRHLFRMPYSLHEKTSLASVVLSDEELDDFDLKDADPLKIQPKDFMPKSKENEASNLIREALDWLKENQISSGGPSKETLRGKYADFKPIKLASIKDEDFPPCVKLILKGIDDGKKRALFVLINFFRSIGMEKEEIEKRIYEWNKKNENPLKEGYVKTQLLWAYNNKPILPPNCKEFYQGIGVCQPDELCNTIKNPVNYTVKKNIPDNKDNKKSKKQTDKK